MKDVNNTNSTSLILQISFLILKLTGSVDWNWFVVFSPLMIVLAIRIIVIIASILLVLTGWKPEDDFHIEFKHKINDEDDDDDEE